MRTLINIISLAGLVLGVYLLYALLWTPPTAKAFATFPVGVVRNVQLEVGRAAFRGQTIEEQVNQARDWLLYTAVASAGLTAEQISQRLFDVPVIRHDYLQPVSEFRYGTARSCDIGGGTVIALLPPEGASGADERRYQLTRIADEYRKDTGAIPEAIVLFEYVVDFDNQSGIKGATLTRRQAVAGRSLFKAESGYYEATIRDMESLKKFLAQIDDLTTARLDSSYFGGLSLTLGGRKLKGREGRGLDVEDVSAMWRFADAGSPNGFTFDEEKQEIESLDNVVAELPSAFSLEPSLGGLKTADLHRANYHSSLAGTKASMTLFYTDLLIKLWALDFLGGQSAPFISELRARPDAPIAPMYRDETAARPHIRTSLGHLETGFLELEEGQLLFAHDIIKLDASSPGSSSVPATSRINPHGAAFLRWWERHREEVFRFEPEFTRLNQMLKWQVLTVWLKRIGESKRLNFLASAPIRYDFWFADWASQQPQLRFKDWPRLGLSSRVEGKQQWQEMAPLQTKIWPEQEGFTILSGGVAPLGDIAQRFRIPRMGGGRGGRIPSTPSRLPPPKPKPNPWNKVNPQTTAFDNKLPIRKPKPDIDYTFSSTNPNRALLSLGARDGLRGHSGEFAAKTHIERSVAREGAAVTVEARAGGARIGALNIAPTPNGFRVGWQSRDIELGQSLARRLSRSKQPPDALLARDPNVEAIIKLENENTYMVKLLGSDGWTKLSAGGTHGSQLPQGWHARVSAGRADAREIQLQWLETQRVNYQLRESSYLVVAQSEQAGAATIMTHRSAAPPRGCIVVEQATPHGTLRIHTEGGGGRTYVSVRDLPPAFRDDPARLASVLGTAPRRAAPGLDTQFTRQVQNKAYGEAARDIARDPRAFKQQLDKHLTQGLEDCDLLLKAGRAEHALHQVDELIGIYGRRPELMVFRGLAQLRSRQATEAARSLELAMRVGEARRGNAFFNEINSRLGNAGAADGVPALAREGETLTMHYNLKALPALDKAVSIDSINTRNALIYVEDAPPFRNLIQDTPGVNNIDWYVSVKPSIQQAVQSQQGVLIKLPKGGVAEFQPTVIYAPQKATQYRAIARTRASQRFNFPVRTGSTGSASEDEPEDEDEESPEEVPQEVYLLVTRSQQTPPLQR